MATATTRETRPKADHASLAALHVKDATRHSTFPVTLTLAEVHLLNRVREDVAAKFLLEALGDGTCPPSHRRLEALDILCDQIGCEDGPNRLRARDAGARAPMHAEAIALAIGPKPEPVPVPGPEREPELGSGPEPERAPEPEPEPETMQQKHIRRARFAAPFEAATRASSDAFDRMAAAASARDDEAYETAKAEFYATLEPAPAADRAARIQKAA